MGEDHIGMSLQRIIVLTGEPFTDFRRSQQLSHRNEQFMNGIVG